MIIFHPRGFRGKPTGTRVPGAPILGDYEVLIVPVTGISKPGNTRYPGTYLYKRAYLRKCKERLAYNMNNQTVLTLR